MWKRLFGAEAVDRSELNRVKGLALARLPAGTSVSVNEIFCNDPGCEGIETIILIMQPGQRTVARKISKYAKDVLADDVADAIGGTSATTQG